MVYEYQFNAIIRDFYAFQVFLFNNGYTNVLSINSNDGIITIVNSTSLDNTSLTQLSDLITNVYTNPYPLDNSDESYISINNSTDVLLNSNQTFTGLYENTSSYSTISFFILSNVGSKLNGINIDFSTDGANTHFTKKYTLEPGNPFIECITIFTKYYRIRYMNDLVNQTSFTIQSIMYKNRAKHVEDTTQKIDVTVTEQVKNADTGGHFRIEGKQITIPANSTGSNNMTWPYNISPLVIKFNTDSSNKNDIINMYVAPNTTIGVITDNLDISSTLLHVNSTVIKNINIGYLVYITNGVTLDSLGEVLSVDYTNNTITVSVANTNSYLAGSYVQMTVNVIKNYVINNPGSYAIGESKVGASYIPKNRIVNVQYTNNSSEEKTFTWYYEYLY